MNWDAIGALGEVLGAIAVIATLLYLAVQTRHARVAVETASTLGTIEGHSRFRQALMTDPDLADLLAKANSGTDLTEGEAQRIKMLFLELFLAGVAGVATQANIKSPRIETEYLVNFLKDNPSGIPHWNEQSDMLYKLVPEFCRAVEKGIVELSSQQQINQKGGS